MLPKLFPQVAFAAITLSGSALAGVLQEPASLLLFPLFDNTRGTYTYLTVTNTNSDFTPNGLLFAGTVDVEFIYINKNNCQEFNRTRRLTPNDTLSVLTRFDNPNQVEGYVYVFAKNPITGKAIKFDWLIGTMRFLGSDDEGDFELQPVPYKAGAALAAGANTDLENGGVGDGIRDLDGLEYATSPDEVLIPRFNAQDDTDDGDLILINLTGGSQFDAIVDFLVYNDNEEVFSAQENVECWRRRDLDDVSGVFDEGFLDSTNNNLNEQMLDGETGWFRVNGLIASSSFTSILNPAILAFLIEEKSGANLPVVGTFGGGTGDVAPWGVGSNASGDLVPHSIQGDL